VLAPLVLGLVLVVLLLLLLGVASLLVALRSTLSLLLLILLLFRVASLLASLRAALLASVRLLSLLHLLEEVLHHRLHIVVHLEVFIVLLRDLLLLLLLGHEGVLRSESSVAGGVFRCFRVFTSLATSTFFNAVSEIYVNVCWQFIIVTKREFIVAGDLINELIIIFSTLGEKDDNLFCFGFILEGRFCLFLFS